MSPYLTISVIHETMRCQTRKTPHRVLRYALTGIPTLTRIRLMDYEKKGAEGTMTLTRPVMWA